MGQHAVVPGWIDWLNPTHDPYKTLIAIYLLRLVLGIRDSVDISNIEPLFISRDYTKLTGLSANTLEYLDEMEHDEFEKNYRRSDASKGCTFTKQFTTR